MDGNGFVSRPLPLRVQVAASIKSSIVRGEWSFGAHLVEAETAAKLGVSRIPVREAFQLLAREGWVDLRSGFGAFVHRPTAREIDEVFSVRSALEAEAAYQSARRVGLGLVPADELRLLHRIFNNGEADIAHGISADIVDHNAELHAGIIRLADNHVLAELSSSIEERVRWYFAAIAVRRAPASWEEHAGVIEAIDLGDCATAKDRMWSHCDRSRLGLITLDLTGSDVEEVGVTT
jgi:DNA-binding GntR family transcriptional regulator